MASGYAGEAGADCGAICCICCSEGFLDWLNFTRCGQGNSRQAGCCGPCWKRALNNDDDDWIDKERADRQRKRQGRARKGANPDAHATDAQQNADPSVVNEQPKPRTSMETGRPQEITSTELAQRQGLSENGAAKGDAQ